MSLFWTIIIASVLFEIGGDIFSKQGMNSGNNVFVGVGVVLYLIGSIFWLVSLKFGDLSKVGIVFILLNTVLIVASGVVVFGDRLSGMQWMGVVVGIVALVMINLGGIK